jgi:DNA helicase-2/ATP-dependent DNA helicase PcrA
MNTFDKKEFSHVLATTLRSFTTPEHTSLTCSDVKGELEFRVNLTKTNKRVVIRSTIGKDGKSAPRGKDSIRIWLEYFWPKTGRWHPLKKHKTRWTTRADGWESRLSKKVEEMVRLGWKDSGYEPEGPRPEPKPEPKPKPESKPEPKPKKSRDFISRPTAVAVGQSKKAFEPSRYQSAIFDFVKSGQGHGVVNAVAGSGKTTTNIGCLEYTDPKMDIALVAFNRHIAEEQAQKAPSHVQACTLHSLGYSNIRSSSSGAAPKVDPYKVSNILRNIERDSRTPFNVVDLLAVYRRDIAKLVSLVKNTLADLSDTSLAFLCDRYGLNFNGSEKEAFELARRAYTASSKQHSVIDYDDMIEWCATSKVSCEAFDVLVVDEAQDLNKAQIEMALRSVRSDGRILATGDRWQSIYGFRGADTNAIPSIIERLGATQLPLSITYRCPVAVVEMVNQSFPEIDFQARKNAKEGQVRHIEAGQLVTNVAEGDLVLCRVNAPLVRPAFELLRQGTKAVILGRDIGHSLDNLVRKMIKKHDVVSLNSLVHTLAEYEQREVQKLLEAKKTGQAQTVEDQVETIIALSDGAESIHEVQARIKDVFSDTREGVTFSSVHKAKGTEAENVFILKPELMPHPKAKMAWEAQQERNIKYVAWTRAKDTLTFVRTEERRK